MKKRRYIGAEELSGYEEGEHSFLGQWAKWEDRDGVEIALDIRGDSLADAHSFWHLRSVGEWAGAATLKKIADELRAKGWQ